MASSSARSAGEFFDDVTHSTKESLDGAVELRAHSVNLDNCHLLFCDVTIHNRRAIFRMRKSQPFVGRSPNVRAFVSLNFDRYEVRWVVGRTNIQRAIWPAVSK